MVKAKCSSHYLHHYKTQFQIDNRYKLSNSQALKLQALDVVRASRAVRPNDGFLKQLEVLQTGVNISHFGG